MNIIHNYKLHSVASIVDMALVNNKKVVLSNGDNLSVKVVDWECCKGNWRYVIPSPCNPNPINFVYISLERMAKLHIDKFQEWDDMILINVSE